MEAELNMPNTLRRKMFKLGGSANTHGVGITSGLKMKKGGSIAPLGLAGKNPIKKMGPDNKVREAHSPLLALQALGSGALALGSRAIGLPALRALGSAIKQGTTQPLRQFVTKGDDIVKFVRTKTPNVPGGQIAGPFSGVTSKIVGQTTPSGLTQALRVAQLATPIGGATGGITGLTMAGLDRLGITKPGDDDSFLESAGRNIGKISLNVSPIGAPIFAASKLLSTEDRPLTDNLYDILAGTKKEKEDEIETTGAIETDKQEKQMDRLKSDAEEKIAVYRSLMGTPDNTAVYAEALLNFGAEALMGTGDQKADIAKAIRAGTQPLLKETKAREATDQQLRGLAIQEVIAQEADDRKLLQQAAASGPKQLSRMTRFLEARDAGVSAIVEIDSKGKITNATKGSVLADLDATFGGKFVAINQKGSAKPFNNIEDALAFAATKGGK